MKKTACLIIAFTVQTILYSPVYADMNTQMSNMFNRMGFSTNPTGAGYYEGQTRGYFTGGSLSVRAPYDSINPVSLSYPSINAGCGGIDFHLGSMSYINGDKIVSKLRAIGQNAAGYIFQLALATVSPEIKSIITEFENITNMVNQMNMDSCTAAKAIVDYGQRKYAEATQDACTDYQTFSGGSSDRVAGAESCRANMVSIQSGLSGQDKDTYSPFKNYTYEALRNVDPINNDMDLLESLMSTMGTIIIRAGSPPMKDYIPPTITFRMLVNGATGVPVLSCGNSDCTNINSNNLNIKAFKTYVEDEMFNILDAIVNGTALTNSQMSFVQSNSVPIYKILNVLSVYPYVGKSFIKKYAESIAITLAYFWVEEGFEAVIKGIQNVEDVSGLMKEFIGTIQNVRDDANAAMIRAESKLTSIDIMIREVERIEEKINRSLSKGFKRGYTYANLGAN